MGLFNAPEEFQAQLEAIGPGRGIRAVWNDKIELWQIRHSIPDDPDCHVFTVANDDGSYRPLDERTIWKAKQLFWGIKEDGSDYEAIPEMFAHEQKVRDSNDRDLCNTIEQITDENWRHMRGIPQFALGGI